MKTISKYIIFTLIVALQWQPVFAENNEPLFGFYIVSENQIKDATNQYMTFKDENGKQLLVDSEKIIGSRHLLKAEATITPQNFTAINISFNKEGTKRFGDFSRKLIGKKIAIVLKGKIVSTPVIQSPIYTGRGMITGHFTLTWAKQIAAELNTIIKN